MKKVLASVLISSTFLLTGCGTSGLAAQIGETKISQTQVQSSINQILAERAKIDTSSMNLIKGEALNRNTLRFALISEIFAQIADEQGFVVSKGQIDSMRSQLINQIGGEANLPAALVSASIAPQDFNTYVKTVIISNALTDAITASKSGDPNTVISNLIQEKISAVGLKVNPRYGKWSIQDGDLAAFDPAGSALTK